VRLYRLTRIVYLKTSAASILPVSCFLRFFALTISPDRAILDCRPAHMVCAGLASVTDYNTRYGVDMQAKVLITESRSRLVSAEQAEALLNEYCDEYDGSGISDAIDAGGSFCGYEVTIVDKDGSCYPVNEPSEVIEVLHRIADLTEVSMQPPANDDLATAIDLHRSPVDIRIATQGGTIGVRLDRKD
jgi:hypothetical protein